MVRENRHQFLKSLSSELDVQADRIRQLIGSRHWTTDGAHKEGLLAAFLARYTPSSAAIARGFVIHETMADGCSTEQDLLLIDTYSEAPIFRSGDIAVTMFPRVMAAISVKSSFSYAVMDAAIDGLATISRTTEASSSAVRPWMGIYFFDTDTESTSLTTAAEHVVANVSTRSVLSIGAELVVRIGSTALLRTSRREDGAISAIAYRLDSLSTGVFLARLLAHIARRRGAETTFESLLVDLDDGIKDAIVVSSA